MGGTNAANSLVKDELVSIIANEISNKGLRSKDRIPSVTLNRTSENASAGKIQELLKDYDVARVHYNRDPINPKIEVILNDEEATVLTIDANSYKNLGKSLSVLKAIQKNEYQDFYSRLEMMVEKSNGAFTYEDMSQLLHQKFIEQEEEEFNIVRTTLFQGQNLGQGQTKTEDI